MLWITVTVVTCVGSRFLETDEPPDTANVGIANEPATVELSAYWRPPLLTLFVPEGIRLDVEATARSVFG